jgi:hypothetical protein
MDWRYEHLLYRLEGLSLTPRPTKKTIKKKNQKNKKTIKQKKQTKSEQKRVRGI